MIYFKHMDNEIPHKKNVFVLELIYSLNHNYARTLNCIHSRQFVDSDENNDNNEFSGSTAGILIQYGVLQKSDLMRLS